MDLHLNATDGLDLAPVDDVLDIDELPVAEPALAPLDLDLDREAYELAERERRLTGTVDVLMVLHESRSVLERHLPSLLRAIDSVDGRLIAVDNASTDGVAAWLRSLGDSRVVVLEPGENLGYAGAVNLAAEASSADHLVILNPDVGASDADALRRLVTHLERQPRVGAVAPALCAPDGDVQRTARPVPSIGTLLARQTPLGRTDWGRRQCERYLQLPEGRGDAADVDWVIGAAIAMRREAFEAVGGWDDDFFLYFEDVDFCVRLRAAGWLVQYLPGVQLVHDYKRASDRSHGGVLQSRLRREHVKSALRFFAKHPGLLATGRGEPLGWRPVLGGAARRTVDVVVATTLLVLLAPLLVVLAVAVKLDSPGPVFFRQRRVGRHERTFTMFKFRTMHDGADALVHQRFVRKMILEGEPPSYDEEQRPIWKLATDPRVTRVGATLRRWSLDELPQLINVVRGDMTLVGFRPAIPYELTYYPDAWFGRFCVKPGMTGLWQVSGRNERSYEEMVRFDLEYVRRRSIWLDLRLLVLTCAVVLQRRGAV